MGNNFVHACRYRNMSCCHGAKFHHRNWQIPIVYSFLKITVYFWNLHTFIDLNDLVNILLPNFKV